MPTAIVGAPLSTTHAYSQIEGGFALTSSKETTQRKKFYPIEAQQWLVDIYNYKYFLHPPSLTPCERSMSL